MFDKLYVHRKTIVTLAFSKDNCYIVVRYSANQVPGEDCACRFRLDIDVLVLVHHASQFLRPGQ